ncbi:MAG: hypothetical protein U9Q76_06390 [candidate division WOR-3 bacterium]|nr:hypothetical protein [candidate division WOR-3 bacterium]
MISISLLALTLCGDILVQPFRVAEAEPRHHQVHLRAAMAGDGGVAIAWVDSLQLPDHFELDIYIRFFEEDGAPLTDAYKIPKLADTNWIYHPRLDMDSLGNTVLVWIDDKTESNEELSNIRFQAFGPDGTPRGSPKTLYSQVDIGFATPVSLANNGEFAMVFETILIGRGTGIWVQRFDLKGVPQDSAFLAHVDFDSISDTLHFRYPEVAMNDAGDMVVTWLDCIESARMYPRFQVFDAQDEPILPWEPMGHRLDDGGEQCGACRPEPHWLDNDRFVVFYRDYMAPRPTPFFPFLGRVFSERGLIRHPIRTLIWGDSLWLTGADPRGQYSTAIAPNDSFAYTHTRNHYDYPDTSNPWKQRNWEHGAGFLGQVINNEPWRRTNLFEYTPPWGADTVNSNFGNWFHDQAPAVACCDDRIVWVYSRLNTDTIFEAFAMITDWDMGIGVVEPPIVEKPPNWEVMTSIGSQIVLRYQDSPDGFRASIFDASGRKVDEVHATESSGMITWGRCYGPGVYFIVPQDSQAPALKVVLVR